MQLTLYTDYSLRVLLYLMLHDGRIATIADIAAYYGISRSHLVKVVHNLGRLQLIDTLRGKGGGVRLAVGAKERRVGEVIRLIEPSTRLIDCLGEQSGVRCSVLRGCALKSILNRARDSFFAELDRYTLGELLVSGQRGASKSADDGSTPAVGSLLPAPG